MSLKIENVSKSFLQDTHKISVLHNVSFEVKTGETLALFGPSGCGKSTLLSLIAGLDTADSGQILIDSAEMSGLSESERTQFRLENMSIIFQNYHLIPYLSALENVSLPLEIRGASQLEAQQKAKAILEQVGLKAREAHLPHQLSGGENQRVAFARAFVARPKLLLADEPSGSLDAESGKKIIDLLFELSAKNNTTLVLVTHDEDIARRANVLYRLGARKPGPQNGTELNR